VAFPPELNQSLLRIKACLLLLTKAKRRKVSSRLLKRTLKQANIPDEMRALDVTELQQRLQEEYKTYYQIKEDATQLRMSALDKLAAALAEKTDTNKEKMLKALRE
jgi:hypothetical protein